MAASPVMRETPFDDRDPGEILHAVAKRHRLRAGEVLLVLIRTPYRARDVVHITALPRKRWLRLTDDELSRLLCEEANRMPMPRRVGAPHHLIMTVIPRPGFAVIGPEEARWLYGWRYSNHFTDALDSDLAVITEHGWTEFMSGGGGHEPRLEPA